MIANYLKIAWRNLLRNQTYAAVNIVGLTLGISCALLVFAFVRYHFSFDTFHPHSDRVYRVTTELHHEEIHYTPGVPSPLIDVLRSQYAIAEQVAGVAAFPNRLVTLPGSGETKKFEENIAFADAAFFDILNFPLVSGDRQSVLKEPNTAVITEQIASKYFGSEDPIGKTIRIDNLLDCTITGILRDLPTNTDRREEIYLPFANLNEHSPWIVEKDWWFSVNRQMQCFVLLKAGTEMHNADKALASLSEKHYPNPKEWQFRFQPISDMHFNPDLGGQVNRKNLWVLALTGLFLIVAACANFINLATAQALRRTKEIGVRKVLGSRQNQLFLQFLSETAVIAGLAMVVSFGVAHLFLPYVNGFFGVELSLNIFTDRYLLAFLPALLLTVVFLSGGYPGLILAGFQPIDALRGKLSRRDSSSFSVRKGLVITQFAIVQLLIIGTLVVANQMRYAMQADMGFEKDAIVMLPLPDNEKSRLSTLYTQLTQIAGIEMSAFCSGAPATEFIPTTGIRFDSRSDEEKFLIALKAGDQEYVPTFGLQIVEGRNLLPSDTVREYLVNETAVRRLGVRSYQDVVGKEATINGQKGTIVGVVKDFHSKSFHESIAPLCITTRTSDYTNCAVKVPLGNLETTLKGIESAWEKTFPGQVYKYTFFDEQIARFYQQDRVFLRLIQIFALISVLIGCLGLFGLISYMVSVKKKEIGIRKVLGATVTGVVALLSQDLLKLVFIAIVLASPIAYLAMHKWLEDFAYRIEIQWWMFVAAGLAAVAIALLTVSWQAVRAAVANPVKSLRSE